MKIQKLEIKPYSRSPVERPSIELYLKFLVKSMHEMSLKIDEIIDEINKTGGK